MHEIILSEEKAPKILVDFSKSPLSEAYLFVVHGFQYFLSSKVTQVERQENSII